MIFTLFYLPVHVYDYIHDFDIVLLACMPIVCQCHVIASDGVVFGKCQCPHVIIN